MGANGLLTGAFSAIAVWCYKKTFCSGNKNNNYSRPNNIRYEESKSLIQRRRELQEAEESMFNTRKAYVIAVPNIFDLENVLTRCSSGYDIYKIIGPTIREEMRPIIRCYNNNIPQHYVLYTFVLRKGYELIDEQIVHIPTKIILGEKLPPYPWAYSGLNTLY